MILRKIKKIFSGNNFSLVKKHLKRVKQVIAYRYFEYPTDMDLGDNSHINPPSLVFGKKNIHLGNNCNIDWESRLYCTKGQFIMKDFSGAAVGLTVITNNHHGKLGEFFKQAGNKNLEAKNVIVHEDVWIGANVTLLAGTIIGRGAIVGAGSLLAAKIVPPYAIVIGNPGKIIGFRFTPSEIIEHEEALYSEENRLSLEYLENNYNKYYLNQIKEIKAYTSIMCK